jgi:glutathione-independent formaldehyde dehydrogenase
LLAESFCWFDQTTQHGKQTYDARLGQLDQKLAVYYISHRLKLAEGPDAYKHFDARDNGWTKVVLKPAA